MKPLTKILWIIALSFICTSPTLAQSPPPVYLRLRDATFDPLARPIPHTAPPPQLARLHLVQFPGPIRDAGYTQLLDAGLDIVSYIPDYAYLVWGRAAQIQRAQATAPLRWTGDYLPAYVLHSDLKHTAMPGTTAVKIQVYAHADAHLTLADIQNQAQTLLTPPYLIRQYYLLSIRISTDKLNALAALPDVVNIEPLRLPRKQDEIQGLLLAGLRTPDGTQPAAPGYLYWLTATVGFTTTASAYPIIDITDDGIDDGDDTPNHPDFYTFGDPQQADRLVYNTNWTTDLSADGVGGHGNLNAAIASGYNDHSGFPYTDAQGYNYGLGLNPFGRVAGSKVFANPGPWEYPHASYEPLLNSSYVNGARISSNSWGADTYGQYTSDDWEYDLLVRDAQADVVGNQPMIILVAAGNYGADSTTTTSPGNAKNVITVGASESYRPTWTDGCGIPASSADNAQDIVGFSSRGPTQDGRVKPDLVAPGTHIQAAASAIPNYSGEYICDSHHPTGQTLYAASSGTSHATPAVAGAAALLYRFLRDEYSLTSPSPALIKAYLVNSAQHLARADAGRVSAGETLPSNNQGFGLVNLGRAFDSTPRVLRDQSWVFHDSGEYYTLHGNLADPSQPFRVTLAWTDAPGALTGAAYVNNLDLVVQVNRQTYRGNHFEGANSIPGGQPDPRNNVESVFLPPPVSSGAFTLTVHAANIAGDGLPNNSDPTDQDFALVCYNCSLEADFTLQVTPVTQALCQGDSATYTLTTTPVMSFSHPITLALHATPPGITATLSPNPVPPGDHSHLILSHTLQPGAYRFTITGQAARSTHTVTTWLDIFAALTNTLPLHTPADHSANIVRQPTLSWHNLPRASYYFLEIATASHFEQRVYTATIAANAAGVNTDDSISHTLHTVLPYATQHYWRVTPHNVCGAGVISAAYQFLTQPQPRVFCRTVNLAIPNNAPSGLVSTLTLPTAGQLIDLDVTISATHTWVGDLSVSLAHLDSDTTITLVDRPGIPDSAIGCGSDGLNVYLDDAAPRTVEDSCGSGLDGSAYLPHTAYRPNAALAAFNGLTLGGTWQLRIADHSPLDEGALHTWCLSATLQHHVYLTLVLRGR